MTRRRNPFRIIRRTAAVVGIVLFVALAGGLIATAIGVAASKDPSILWQVPLGVVAGLGIVFLVALVGSAIARGWRKLERHYDRKDAS